MIVDVQKPIPVVPGHIPTKGPGFSELESKIVSARAVSFDFFDTLFVRTLLDPEDAFDILGKRFGIKAFRQLRRTAQAEAFKRMLHAGRREITLEGIYACLQPLSVSAEELMLAEYELELSLVLPNHELLPVFTNVMERGVPVVITSDMYLPSSFFRESLKRHGIPEIPLFISSERNATKRDSGQLYDVVASELGLDHERILHIGDNPHSDISQAHIKGLMTFHYSEQRRLSAPNHHSPEASLARGLIRKHRGEIPPESFQELGFLYGGPAAVGFLGWVAEQAQRDRIEHVLFLSRDGYILDLLARSWANNGLPKFSYFYGSRTVFTLAGMNDRNFNDHLPFLLSGAEGLSPGELLERINVAPPAKKAMEEFGFGDERTVTPDDYKHLANFLYAFRWKILKVCRRNRRGLLAYLHSLGIHAGTRVALIDVGWNGTTQNAFEVAVKEMMDLEVFGYYFCLADTPECLERQKVRRMTALFSSPSTPADLVARTYKNRVVVELFFSAPHKSIVGLESSRDGIVAAQEDPGIGRADDLRQIYGEIACGIGEFARSFNQFLEKASFPASPREVAMPLVEFAASSSWVTHPLMDSIKNFDAWSNTRNRNIGFSDYLKESKPS